MAKSKVEFKGFMKSTNKDIHQSSGQNVEHDRSSQVRAQKVLDSMTARPTRPPVSKRRLSSGRKDVARRCATVMCVMELFSITIPVVLSRHDGEA